MHPETIDKYLYIRKTPTWLIRTVYSVGLLTWVGVIYGYSRFITLNLVYFCIVAPIIVFLIFYHVLSYVMTLFYKQFDLYAHKQLIKTFDFRLLSEDGKSLPSVDIFLPICGEDTSVLQNTFEAVSKLRYENFQVYVLDDKGNEEHRILSQEYNFKYFSRENKGHMKKAGNLKHGFERSTGDFIIVYDADFAPSPDFITELLPYMGDLKIGIVQSPQYFQTDDEVHKRSALEYGAAHVQEDFYRFIQVARDRFGAPICCGSNAIYRRKALDSIGGPVQIEHSEDAYTGFELTNKGWRVKYIPIILAVGLCPDNLHAYFHQQHRWCSGSLSLMLNKRFWKSKLTIMQKLCFVSGFMYYLSHPVTILLSFQVFFLLYFYHNYISLINAIPFIPVIIFAFVVIPSFRITKQKYGSHLARNAYSYSYSHASVVAFLKRHIGWQPTNIRKAKVSQAYREQLSFGAGYFLLYMAFVGFAIGYGVFNIFNINYYSLLFWIFYNSIATLVIIIELYLYMHQIKLDEFESGAIKKSTFFKWYLKTLGIYVIIFVIIFIGTIYYGNLEKGTTNDVTTGQT